MTDSPILGYKKSIDRQEPYWYAKIEGKDYKYIRVVAGLALPILDRVGGAVIILAERYSVASPPTLTAIAAACGEWSAVESALAQYRRDVKFGHIIVDKEEARRVIWRMRGLNYGLNEIPLVSYAAPSYALSEIGRNKTDQLIAEKRLIIPSHIERECAYDNEMACIAIQCAVCWCLDSPAYYAPLRQRAQGIGNVIGVTGL
jgi:hypothetical protein